MTIEIGDLDVSFNSGKMSTYLANALLDHILEGTSFTQVTNIYIGLGRYRRGEKLNAYRFIQGYAMDRIIELSDYIPQEQQHGRDPFSKPRRYEQRYPNLASELPNLMQGYDRCVESALAILDFLPTLLSKHLERNH